MPFRHGFLSGGHPFVKIIVSADGTNRSEPFPALIDTGYSDFVSVSLILATQLGLKPHTTTRYELADGRLTEPVPVALGYAGIEGDKLVGGLISISRANAALVGVKFLQLCRKGLVILGGQVMFLPEDELEALAKARKQKE